MLHTRKKKKMMMKMKKKNKQKKKEWNERDRKKGRPLFLLVSKCDVFCAAGGLGGWTDCSAKQLRLGDSGTNPVTPRYKR
jgi:hypothetical protein